MRRKLKTLKAKQGHSANGSPRTLIELAVYREHHNNVNSRVGGLSVHWDPNYSGWSNPSRPRDSAISLRPVHTYSAPPPPVIP